MTNPAEQNHAHKPSAYSEKLNDPRWQKKRLEIMQRDDFTCIACHTKTDTLNVHHFYYKPKCNPWDYESETLITLCEKCHKIIPKLHLALARLGNAMLRQHIGISTTLRIDSIRYAITGDKE